MGCISTLLKKNHTIFLNVSKFYKLQTYCVLEFVFVDYCLFLIQKVRKIIIFNTCIIVIVRN
ncbi:hypothetical protein CLU81_3815 [Flavobacterium sp. 9]|nr:hypothetical protein CLU81_3815 [Flavobacterium sp. 9]